MIEATDYRVAYVYSPEYAAVADLLPSNRGRSSVVHGLAKALGLLQHPRVDVVPPALATAEELKRFHSAEYIDFVLALDKQPKCTDETALEDNINILSEPSCVGSVDDEINWSDPGRLNQFGLLDDCAVFPELPQYVSLVAGGSLVAALHLIRGTHRYAIHWDGGRHHAKRHSAAGFCYVNDIVLAILALRRGFDKVLYIDIDLHHGDGVEAAFQYSEKVFTLSFHRHAPGFFPGTGACESVGKGKGKYTCLNVPLQEGLGDGQFHRIFSDVTRLVSDTFRPDVVVMQCGSDGLTQDPYKEWNLTPNGFGKAVQEVLRWDIPTLFLGGGGYHTANVARCNAYLTSLIIPCPDITLDTEIPDHPHMELYAPSYELGLPPGTMQDHNSPALVEEIALMVRQRQSGSGQSELPKQA
ncbi:hypothetical protein IWQ61_009252 [Dispira simplex]|nr:hypothetical protein IWQ61_009252 [Dispira simplex]